MRPADAALAAVALLAGAAALAFTWQPGMGSLFDDSVSYLLLAQAASPFGAPTPAAIAAAALEKYPPLFGWLIALTGGAFDWRFAHALVAVAFAASVLSLGWHVRAIAASSALGLAAALAYAFMPGAWLNLKGILSEFPYMAISFAALALYAGAGGQALPARRAALLGALLAAAFLTRTIGVALAVALVAAEAWRYLRDRERARIAAMAWMAAVPAACAALWYLSRPAAGEDAYLVYGTRVARDAAAGGSGFAAQLLAVNAAALRDAWLTALVIYWGDPWKPGYLLAAALGIAGAAATLARAARGEADGLYVAGFVAILLAWPFPGQMFRLALPVLPLVLAHFLWGWWRILQRATPATAARRAPWAAVLPLALCMPAVLFYIVPRARDDAAMGEMRSGHIAEYYRIPSRGAAEASAAAQIGVFADLARIGQTTPPGARVMWYWPSYVALLAGRDGVPLEPPRETADLAAQARATRADFIYLAELHPRDSAGRDGHPMAPFLQARELGRVVWQRTSGTGALQGVLLEIDKARLGAGAR